MMNAKGLCKGCADLYKAWAYYHEAVGDFRSANLVFEYGRKALAQPYEELIDAHQNLYIAAGQHVSIAVLKNFFKKLMTDIIKQYFYFSL